MQDGLETDVSALDGTRVSSADAGTAVARESAPASPTHDEDLYFSIRKTLYGWRDAAIHAAPPAVLNNMPSILGVGQLIAEFLMLKSAGMKFLGGDKSIKGLRRVTEPARNLYNACVRGGDHLNVWQVRSTVAGITAWTLGAIVPNVPESKEKVEESLGLYHRSPVRYLMNQFQHGFYFFNPTYKREQMGMGVTLAGTLSALSGFMGNGRKVNAAHTVGGIVTALAGSFLWFAPTAEQGWKRFGATLWARLTTVPFNVVNRVRTQDHWGTYSAAQTMFTGNSIAAFMLGGAEKAADGTIVDHTKIRQEARKKYAQEDHLSVRSLQENTPSMHVSDVSRQASVPSLEENQSVIAK